MSLIIAADIGGTNSRFAAFSLSDDRLDYLNSQRLVTHEASSLAELLDRLGPEGSIPPQKDWDAAVLAVPGAVEDRSFAHLANVAWEVDVTPLRKKLAPAPVFLINDFEAQAYACRSPAALGAKPIKPGIVDPTAPTAVVGAGTGLGHCALKPDGRGRYVSLPSEAGHATFALYGDDEIEYLKFLMSETNEAYPFGDLVVTGLGLTLLHKFLTGQDLTPAEVAKAITPDSETARWFARFYGRACRNYALTVLPLGGLYLAGGVAAHNPFLVDNDVFRNEFVASDSYGALLEKIPVFQFMNEDSGLWGAAMYGQLVLGEEGRAED